MEEKQENKRNNLRERGVWLWRKVVWTDAENIKKISFAELENIWLEENYNKEESRIGRDGSGRHLRYNGMSWNWTLLSASFFKPTVEKLSQKLCHCLCQKGVISKDGHSDSVHFVTFGYPIIQIRFIHIGFFPSEYSTFLVANIQPKCAKFHFCFLFPFRCKNIILGAKEGRSQAANLPGHFFTFLPLVPELFISGLCKLQVEAETACIRSTLHHMWS